MPDVSLLVILSLANFLWLPLTGKLPNPENGENGVSASADKDKIRQENPQISILPGRGVPSDESPFPQVTQGHLRGSMKRGQYQSLWVACFCLRVSL